METNKRTKHLKRVFLLFVIALIVFFFIFYLTFKDIYNTAANAFVYDIRSIYPELSISTELFKQSFTFQFPAYFYILIFIMIICLIMMYYYISNFYKSYSKDVEHIIQEIDSDEFTPSTLEGELSLLEEKIYFYKKRNDKYIEQSIKEKKQLSDYIENIAHQIKTPMTSIRLNEEVVMMSKDMSLLEKNKQSFDRLEHLFDNFMKLSRIENDTIHFELEVGTMDELLEDVKEQVAPMIKETQFNIESCDISFYYDLQWLCEAIYNIVKNCIEEGVSLIEMKAFYNSEMIHIIIRDNGKGINEEDLPYIFDRFYRSKNNKNQGVGIGLALTKEIIEKHHGFISAYNDNGAVFDLSFPMLDIKEKVI